MKPEQQHEISERIEQGKRPKDVVKDVRERAGRVANGLPPLFNTLQQGDNCGEE